MALTRKQLESLDKVNALPLGKILCIFQAAVKAYKCIKAAGGDPVKIAACGATLVADIEKCIKDKG
jgi:hypothetical protein